MLIAPDRVPAHARAADRVHADRAGDPRDGRRRARCVGLPLLCSADGPDLGGEDFARVIFGALIASVLSVALGVGVGLLVKNQVAAVIGTLVWILIRRR